MNSTASTGADILAQELIKSGVDTIFCITGAGNLAIVDAIHRTKKIRLIFSHHEQAATMEANGYARISGKLGVVLVTTGGGTTNVATGALSANLDSVPVIIISGNESSFHINRMKNMRAVGVQGFESVEFLRPLVKFSYRVKSECEISDSIKKCIQIAQTPRRGVVHIDIPMDFQRKQVEQIIVNNEIDLAKVLPNASSKENMKNSMSLALDELYSSKNPLLYIGEGCRWIANLDSFKKWISQQGIPFLLSWSAIDLFDDCDELNMGRSGIYGDRASNILLQKCDFLLCIGTRLAIPQIGYDSNDFARSAKIWTIEVDAKEIEKYPPHWRSINADASDFIEMIVDSDSTKSSRKSYKEWVNECKEIQGKFPKSDQINKDQINSSLYIHSFEVIDSLCNVLPSNSIVTTDVGAGLLTGHFAFKVKAGQRLFTSQGLGEMGFGLPAAIGAHFANPDATLVCLNTDGGIMFNLQELQLIKEHSIPIKLFVFNNLGYSMISISQKNLFEGRIIGSSSSSGLSFPNFRQLAELFDFEYFKVQNSNNLKFSLAKIQKNTAQLFEIIMDPEQKYLPRLGTAAREDGTLVSPPIEDLDPLIKIDDLQHALGYQPHQNSFLARGLDRK